MCTIFSLCTDSSSMSWRYCIQNSLLLRKDIIQAVSLLLVYKHSRALWISSTSNISHLISTWCYHAAIILQSPLTDAVGLQQMCMQVLSGFKHFSTNMARFPEVIFCVNIGNVLLQVAACAVHTTTFRTNRLLLLMTIIQRGTTIFWHAPWKSRPRASVWTSTIFIITKSKRIRYYHYKCGNNLHSNHNHCFCWHTNLACYS